MITRGMYNRLYERSDGMCEGMVRGENGIYSRCWVKPVEAHHLLTRARGGGILDEVGDIAHLIHLCSYHHRMSDGESAYLGGLLIDGYVSKENGRIVYKGSDPELNRKYGRKR